jgi:hypothetical protein
MAGRQAGVQFPQLLRGLVVDRSPGTNEHTGVGIDLASTGVGIPLPYPLGVGGRFWWAFSGARRASGALAFQGIEIPVFPEKLPDKNRP